MVYDLWNFKDILARKYLTMCIKTLHTRVNDDLQTKQGNFNNFKIVSRSFIIKMYNIFDFPETK